MGGTLRAALLYAALTVALTWPLARLVTVMEPGDPAYFAWVMGWEIHALSTDPAALPHGNIYHPARYTVGMDEPILGTALTVLPLAAVTSNAVLLFNVARLLSFVLSALSARFLARELGAVEPVALVAGALFAFSPIRLDQIGHLSTLGTQSLPLIPAFLIRYARDGRARDVGLAALAFVHTAYACGYHGLFGILLVPCFALPLLASRPGLLLRALPAAALAGVALLPLRALHRAAFVEHGFVRPVEHAVRYAASLESFLATSSWNRVWGELTTPFRVAGANNLFPGLLVVALAALALWPTSRWPIAPRRPARALAALGIAASLVALGPEVRLLGHGLIPGPYALVRATLPMFESVRVTSRAGIYLALALVGLAALGLQRLGLRPRAVALVGALGLLETLIVPIPTLPWMQVIDTRAPLPPVYAWLASQPGDFPLAEMPLLPADGQFRRPAHEESVYMVWSTWHWKRLVNGNAGVEPAAYRDVRERCRRFPEAACTDALRALGVGTVVVHRAGFGPNQWARVERELPRSALRLVKDFGDGDAVYAISSPGSASPAPDGGSPP